MHTGRVAYRIGHESPVGFGPPPQQVERLRFGRLFGRARALSDDDAKYLKARLTELGQGMNPPSSSAPPAKVESDIPSGYTYLGQFIAHEITFDSTGNLLANGAPFKALRTPQIDLDSLYGGTLGRAWRPELYEADRIHLKVGMTDGTGIGAVANQSFPNDLPRGGPDGPKAALVGDPRNDENLPLAQTHLAFIRFHNKVVDRLAEGGPYPGGLFKAARELVIRHFQWIVLYDYLPRLVDAEVLGSVMRDGPRWFRPTSARALFMPLEFSAAAFRVGHSMVRATYDWNDRHGLMLMDNGKIRGHEVGLEELFSRTGSNGTLGGRERLPSDWVIDWRRFYDFTPLDHVPPVPKVNRTSKLDTILSFRLSTAILPGAPLPAVGPQLEAMQTAIAVRNLLRGFYLRLPSGEQVAEQVGETPLTPEQVADGPHRDLLSDPAFRRRTPLWYYILKEAELSGGNRLGRVGSHIVAETLVGIIQHSRYSILKDPDWRPSFGRCTLKPGATPADISDPQTTRFEMIDLLNFADVVDPIGRLDAGQSVF